MRPSVLLKAFQPITFQTGCVSLCEYVTVVRSESCINTFSLTTEGSGRVSYVSHSLMKVNIMVGP